MYAQIHAFIYTARTWCITFKFPKVKFINSDYPSQNIPNFTLGKYFAIHFLKTKCLAQPLRFLLRNP